MVSQWEKKESPNVDLTLALEHVCRHSGQPQPLKVISHVGTSHFISTTFVIHKSARILVVCDIRVSPGAKDAR